MSWVAFDRGVKAVEAFGADRQSLRGLAAEPTQLSQLLGGLREAAAVTAEGGEANRAVTELFAKALGVPKARAAQLGCKRRGRGRVGDRAVDARHAPGTANLREVFLRRSL